MKPGAHEPATADLLQRALARAPEGRQRRNAARALGQLGPLARHTVYDLATSALEDPDPDVRRECVAAALRDPSPRVRFEAAVTLTTIWNAMVGTREGARGRS